MNVLYAQVTKMIQLSFFQLNISLKYCKMKIVKQIQFTSAFSSQFFMFMIMTHLCILNVVSRRTNSNNQIISKKSFITYIKFTKRPKINMKSNKSEQITTETWMNWTFIESHAQYCEMMWWPTDCESLRLQR